jgi:hypothetical protein
MPTEAPGLHNFFFTTSSLHCGPIPTTYRHLHTSFACGNMFRYGFQLLTCCLRPKSMYIRQNAQSLLRVATEFESNPSPVDGQKDLPTTYGAILTDCNPPPPYRVDRPSHGAHDPLFPPSIGRRGSPSPTRELAVICHHPGCTAVLHLTCFDEQVAKNVKSRSWPVARNS